MKGSDNPNTSLLLVEGSAPASPSAGDQRVFIDSADHVPKLVTSAGAVHVLASNPSLSNQLSGNVTMTTADTFYDGPALSLAAGTWLLIASLSVTNAADTFFTAKLWDGTTVAAAANSSVQAGFTANLSLTALVSPGSTTTYKASVAGNSASSTLYATPPTDATGCTNKAATLTAIRVL